jgi:hypothetical protein
VVDWIRDLDEELFEERVRCRKTNKLCNNIDASIYLSVKVSVLVINDEMFVVTKVGSLKLSVDANRLIYVLVAGFVTLIVKVSCTISSGYHVDDSIVPFISEVDRVPSHLIEHCLPLF